jgi:hypothetical protein
MKTANVPICTNNLSFTGGLPNEQTMRNTYVEKIKIKETNAYPTILYPSRTPCAHFNLEKKSLSDNQHMESIRTIEPSKSTMPSRFGQFS